MNVTTTGRPCRQQRVTSYTMTESLGDRLLDVALAADRRVDVDDDLDLIRDVAEQVTAICGDVLDQIDAYQARSWTYRLYRVTAWLYWQSRGAQDLRVLDELVELCQRMPGSLVNRYRVAEGYARDGWPDRVRDCRTTVFQALWFHAGRCLHKGAPR
jgi:hypothetical protein